MKVRAEQDPAAVRGVHTAALKDDGHVADLADALDTRLIEAYLRSGVLPRDEVRHGLAAMLRFRFAVQADYFARRIAEDDLTGIADPVANERGLADAREPLRVPAGGGRVNSAP